MEPKCLKEFLKRQSVKLMKNWLDDMEDVSLQFKYEVLASKPFFVVYASRQDLAGAEDFAAFAHCE